MQSLADGNGTACFHRLHWKWSSIENTHNNECNAKPQQDCQRIHLQNRDIGGNERNQRAEVAECTAQFPHIVAVASNRTVLRCDHVIMIICGHVASRLSTIISLKLDSIMRRSVLIAFIAAAPVISAGWAFFQHLGNTMHQPGMEPPADTRELVQFPPEMVEHTLTNMRDHLVALQEINAALAKGDSNLAAKVAEECLGMTSLKSHGAHEVAKYMPQGMKGAGSSMHRAASRFAVEAQNSAISGDLKPALGALGDVMSGCVGCHAGYRLK